MSIWEFWADPVGWFINNYTWFLTDPPWLVLANLAFWPSLFAKWWLHDRWDDHRRRRAAMRRA